VLIDDAAETGFEELFELRNERDEVAEWAQMEPYVMNLRNPYDGEMKMQLEDPAQHLVFFYDRRIEQVADELEIGVRELLPEEDPEEYSEGDPVPDGGRKYFFAWMTENGNLLYDAGVNGDAADGLYTSVDEAESAIKRLADTNPEQQDRYEKSTLYMFKKMDKEMQGVEAFTEQAGLGQFETDGGYSLPPGYDENLEQLAEAAEEVSW
jgi:hypothetical protein